MYIGHAIAVTVVSNLYALESMSLINGVARVLLHITYYVPIYYKRFLFIKILPVIESTH